MIDSADNEKKTKPRGGVQPRKQASKSRAVVKMRRKQIIKDILAGKTQQDAGIAAGFSPKTAADQVSKTLRNPLVQDALQSAMEKHGVSDDCIAERLQALLHGTKVIAANVFAPGSSTDLADAGSMTKDFVEVPDNVAIAKGIEIACKIKGVFSEKREVDIKRPLTILVRRFCADDDPPSISGSGGATQ